jgi:alpha-ribazole phosphatase
VDQASPCINGEQMVTTIYLVRHGQTVDSEEKKYKGHIDVPLSEEGIEQAKRLGSYMIGMFSNGNDPGKGLDGIYCSDLSRAVKTAENIAESFGLTPHVIPEIRERNFGRWEGMTFDEIRTEYPREFDAWADDPVKFSPVGGESTEEVNDRVIPAFHRIVRNHEGEKIALVAHGGVNRVILCNVLGIPLQHVFRVEQDFTGLSVIEFYSKMPVVRTLNSTAHLLNRS